MKNYLVKTPNILKVAYNNCIWHIKENAQSVYLTFDDGPHPSITPFVLDELKRVQAKATFFCIGNNVDKYPDIFQRIKDEGHGIGNHTQNHKNGWKTKNFDYFMDVKKAAEKIPTKMFRPPYGRITYAQGYGLRRMFPKLKIIMWDVLSGDFDINLSPQACFENVKNSSRAGSIVVFHDSDKAYDRLVYTLPRYLDFCKDQGWQMKKLNF